MPYGYRKTKSGYTVYKKDTGEIVGHTTAKKLKAYLAALHMHTDENIEELRNLIRKEIKQIIREKRKKNS